MKEPSGNSACSAADVKSQSRLAILPSLEKTTFECICQDSEHVVSCHLLLFDQEHADVVKASFSVLNLA